MNTSLKWVLTISLLLNMLLIGIVIGRWTRGLPFPSRQMRPPHLGMDAVRLPSEKREKFEMALRALREKERELSPQIEKTRQELVSILEAPHFNEQAFMDKSKELDALFASGKDRMVRGTVELAREFTQKERRVLAEHLRRPPPPPAGPPPR